MVTSTLSVTAFQTVFRPLLERDVFSCGLPTLPTKAAMQNIIARCYVYILFIFDQLSSCLSSSLFSIIEKIPKLIEVLWTLVGIIVFHLSLRESSFILILSIYARYSSGVKQFLMHIAII